MQGGRTAGGVKALCGFVERGHQIVKKEGGRVKWGVYTKWIE